MLTPLAGDPAGAGGYALRKVRKMELANNVGEVKTPGREVEFRSMVSGKKCNLFAPPGT